MVGLTRVYLGHPTCTEGVRDCRSNCRRIRRVPSVSQLNLNGGTLRLLHRGGRVVGYKGSGTVDVSGGEDVIASRHLKTVATLNESVAIAEW